MKNIQQFTKEVLSVLLVLVLAIGYFPGMTFTAKAATTDPDYSWYASVGGSSGNNFQIGTAQQLKALANIVNGDDGQTAYDFSGKSISLTADIDLTSYAGGTGWKPIGAMDAKLFKGSFDGNKHLVKNLTISATSYENYGLFGFVSTSVISNLGIIGCQISGGDYTGSIAGYSGSDSIVKNCFATGSVKGAKYVGGLIGSAFSTDILNCYSTCQANGNASAGGILGQSGHNTSNYTKMLNCYATGSVNGSSAGGILGKAGTDGTVSNCIALNKEVSAGGRRIGSNATLSGNYAWDQMPGTWADLGADNENGADASLADIEGVALWAGFITPDWSRTPSKLPILSGFPAGSQDDGIPVWIKPTLIISGTGESGNPYLISNETQLRLIAQAINSGDLNYIAKSYQLVNDIVLTGGEWTPIGNSTNRFTGIFDGNGKVIKGMTIATTTQISYAGFFGYVGSGGVVKNLGVVGASITGNCNYSGLVVSRLNSGTATGCFSSGTVNPNYTQPNAASIAGGVVGYVSGTSGIEGTVVDCYSSAVVTATWPGGVVGRLSDVYSKLNRSYTTGAVTAVVKSGTTDAGGGVVGENNNANIANSYALNPSIGGNSTAKQRIAFTSSSGTYTNNYAWSGISGTWSFKTINGRDGLDADTTFVGTATNWATNGFTSANGWTIADNKLPILNIFEAGVQNDIMPLWLGGTASYALTLLAGTGGSIPLGGSGNYQAGQVIRIQAIANTGYGFVNWSAPNGAFADANSAVTTYTMPSMPVTVTANFTNNIYTVLTSVVSGNGSLSITSGGPSPVTAASNVTLTATPIAGYQIKEWTDNGSVVNGTNQTYTINNIADNHGVTVEFESTAKAVTVASQVGTLMQGTAGTVTYAVTTANIADGTMITLNNTNSVTGVSLSTMQTTNNSTTVTISTTAATPSGTHPLTLTIDGVTSTNFNLVVGADMTKAVTVGSQVGTLTQGTAGNTSYTVITANIADGTAITLNNTNSVAGVSLSTMQTTNNSTTVTISTTAATPSGTHPLTLTIDGVTSTNFNLVVGADMTKAITVGSQIGTLTQGTAGNTSYTVITANIADGTAITLNNTNSVAGVSLSTIQTTNNSTTITIATTVATPSGTHPLTLTIDGVTSASFNLVVSASATTLTSANATITAPVAGASAQNAAAVETATNATGYTVTGLTWNEVLTSPGNKFAAGTTYTATITLTAKAGYKFQMAAFTPSVAGADFVGTTATNGGDVAGNNVTFTVSYPATDEKAVTGIFVKSQPAKLSYTTGEPLDLTGLVATVTYNDGTTEDVGYASFGTLTPNAITMTYTGGSAAAHGDTMSVATHNGKTITLTCNLQTAQTNALTVNATSAYTTTITIPPVNGHAPANAVSNPAAVAQNATVNLPAVTANAGFAFSTWTVTAGGVTITNPTFATGASFVMGLLDVTITADFVPATLSFANQTLSNGTYNTAYSQSITAPTGGSGTYTYSAALPAGLSMSSAGAITGTPNAVATAQTFSVTVTDTVSGATANATYTLTIDKADQTLTAANVTKALGDGDINLTGHASSTTGANSGAVTYTVTTAGAGVSISGTTLSYTSVGTATITATATGSTNYNSATTTFTLTVTAATVLGGTASISGTSAIGQQLTMNTGGITGGSGAFSYQWQADGVNIGANNQTYELTGADAGKTITCVVTRTDASGNITATLAGGVVPYNITVTNIGNDGTDTIVTLSQPTGRASDSITLNYVLGNSDTTNTLTFSGATGLNPVLTAGASISQTYTITASDAVNGVITITATFLHTSLLPQSIVFTNGNQTKVFGGGTFTEAVTSGAGLGLVTYSSSNPAVATVTDLGVVTILAAGSTTITATKAADTTYASASACYTLTITNAPQAVPSSIGVTNETAVGANNGTITGVDSTMEYKCNTDMLYTTVTGTTVLNLAPGTYYVRYSAKPNYDAGVDAIVTITAFSAPTIYSITLNQATGGTASISATSAAAGTEITVSTTLNSYYSFAGWTVTPTVVWTNNNASLIIAKFTMPAGNVTITPAYSYYYNGSDHSSDSGGSGSSGGSTTTTQPQGVSGTTITPTIQSINGVPTVTITEAQIKAALANTTSTNPNVTIIAPAGTKIIFNSSVIKAIGDKGDTSLMIKDGDITLTFSNAAIDTIVSQAKGDIEITAFLTNASKLTEAQKKAVGDRPTFDLAVTSNGVKIVDFNGIVTVSVPYTPKTEENPNAIVVYFVDAQGNLQMVPTGIYDPATKTVTFTTTHFSFYMIGYHYVTFSDVKNHWGKSAIEFAAARNLVSGVGNEQYDPDRAITRAEFVQMMQNVLNLSSVGTTAKYDDVAADVWYFKAIMVAKSAGLLKGLATDSNNFLPNQPITREEMAVILANIALYKGVLTSEKKTDLTSKFSDYNAIKNDYIDELQIVIDNGLMGADGVGNKKFDPQDLTTRAQAAQVQKNLLLWLTKVGVVKK